MPEGPREPPPESPSERPPAQERIGPLLVERHRKADGRALMLYHEAPGDGEAGGTNEVATPNEARDDG